MKNAENKWTGWVEDAEGYMVRFIGPTSRAWSQRKVNEAALALGAATGVHVCSQLAYARSTKLSGCGRGDKWFARLNEVDLNVLMSVVQG